MIAEDGLVKAHVIYENLESGGENVGVGLGRITAMGRGFAKDFEAAGFGEFGSLQG
jgi:hypothetical protein